MNFFGRKTTIGKLEIDPDATNSESASILKRLDRITENYHRLDLVLTELEQKIAVRSPQKSDSSKELQSEKPQSAESQSEESQSADPRKPR